MDQLEINHVLEVPDTPNRQSSQNNDGGGVKMERGISVVTHTEQGSLSTKQNGIGTRKIVIRPPRRINGSGHSGVLDYHEKSSAFGVHDSPYSRNDLLLERKDASTPSHKGKHSFSIHMRKRENPMLNPELSYIQNRENPSVTTNKVDKEKQIDNRNKVGVHINHGESKESASDVQHSVLKNGTSVNTFPRNVVRRRLVRNGCISPHNIAKAKEPVGKDHIVNVEQNYTSPLASSSSSKIPINVEDLVSEDHISRSVKGKGVIVHPSILSEPNAKSANTSCRTVIDIDDEVNETTGANQDTLTSFEEPGGWRTTRNRSQNRTNMLLRRENESSSQNHEHHTVPLGQQSGRADVLHLVVSSLGKRQKRGSTSSNHGECSTSSAPDDSDVKVVGSSKGVRNFRSDRNQNRHRRDTLAPTLEINDSSPQARHHGSQGTACKSEEDATARQLEADEMLARELQEQLYNEMPVFGVSEIDEHLARALQQDDLHHALSGETNTVLPRGRSVANSQRQSQAQSSTNVSRRATRASLARASNPNRLVRLRGRFPGQPRTWPSSRQRNSIFPPNVNVETRIEVLEALEAFSNMGVGSNLLQTRQDFNENDYEMLLALDENNHQHAGASTNRINGLPESVVQIESLEEACAVCLETPTMGDTIRHLPCLHKFHKDCIDPWLQRRASCPVCKSSIT